QNQQQYWNGTNRENSISAAELQFRSIILSVGVDIPYVYINTHPYEDLEKLAKHGVMNSQTVSTTVEILHKCFKEFLELTGKVTGDTYDKLISDIPKF
ncbi:unnamed protein product, partial [Rotaria magnacalcarata]